MKFKALFLSLTLFPILAFAKPYTKPNTSIPKKPQQQQPQQPKEPIKQPQKQQIQPQQQKPQIPVKN